VPRMATIPQSELRDNLAGVLRRAEAGEEMTITVSGRPAASLGPDKDRRWVTSSQLTELWRAPANQFFEADLEIMSGELRDPWAD